MWDFDSLKAAEDEAVGEAPVVHSFLGGEACVRIRAQLHPEENRPEDTSQIVWPAARVLAHHLERERLECASDAVGARPIGTGDSPEGRNVLELGAGTGLVGLAALALGARSVVLTDVAEVLPALQYNAELNDNAGHGTLDVMELNFLDVESDGLPPFPTPPGQTAPLHFDLICCSDCVLWPELMDPLLNTLDQLIDGQNAALLSVAHRNDQAEVFMELLHDNFEVDDISLPPLAQEAQREVNIRLQICRVKRRMTASGPQYKESRLGLNLSSKGGRSHNKTGMNAVQMSVEQAHSMIDELTLKYSTESFQSKLYKAWSAVRGDPKKEQAARHKVCLDIQGPIMTKYGFEDSMEGVIHCLAQFYFPPLSLDATLQKKITHMMLQTKPWEQQERRLQGKLRIWRDEAVIYQPVLDLNRSIKSLKMDLEEQTGIPWQAQRLMLVYYQLQVHDRWTLEMVVPRTTSDTVDLALEIRSEEVLLWLKKLTDCPDLWLQEKVLEETPPELFGDYDFVATAVQCCKTALRYAEVGLRHSRDIAYLAVSHYGLALQWCSEESQADPEIVYHAVNGDAGNGRGIALQYAAPQLRGDVGVVVQAIANDAWAISYASDEVRQDKGVALLALQKNGMVYPELPDVLKDDPEVVWTAVVQNGRVLQSVGPRFQADPEIVLAAVGKFPDALQYAAPAARRDRKIALAAVQGNGEMYRLLAPELQEDPEVAMAAVCSKGCMIANVPDKLYNLELALAAAKQNPTALEFLDKDLQQEVKDVLLPKEAKETGAALPTAADRSGVRVQPASLDFVEKPAVWQNAAYGAVGTVIPAEAKEKATLQSMGAYVATGVVFVPKETTTEGEYLSTAAPRSATVAKEGARLSTRASAEEVISWPPNSWPPYAA